MTKKRIIILISAVVIVFCAVIVAVILSNVLPDSNVKKVSVSITNAKGNTEMLESYTESAYVVNVLKEMGIIGEKNSDGIYDTVEYVLAVNGAVWRFYRNSNEIADSEKEIVKDGDKIEIVYEEAQNDN